jgi:hypothetical protein
VVSLFKRRSCVGTRYVDLTWIGGLLGEGSVGNQVDPLPKWVIVQTLNGTCFSMETSMETSINQEIFYESRNKGGLA